MEAAGVAAGEKTIDLPVLGQTRKLARLAVGRTSEVDLVVSPRRAEPFALKRIGKPLAAAPGFLEALAADGRIAADIHHPNLVEVLEVGAAGGEGLVALAHLTGHDAGWLIQTEGGRSKLTPEPAAIAIVLGAAAGLEHAHDQAGEGGRPLGLVHGCLTPAKVFVTYAGDVKVLDLGIARGAVRIAAANPELLGKVVPCLSPEQARGALPDRATDVFALGLLLWELLTGENPLPRTRRDPGAAWAAWQPPRAAQTRRVPPSLARIIERALAPEPTRRYPTAASFARELEEYARSHDVKTAPDERKALLHAYLAELFPGEEKKASALFSKPPPAAKLLPSYTAQVEALSMQVPIGPWWRRWLPAAIVLLLVVVAATALLAAKPSRRRHILQFGPTIQASPPKTPDLPLLPPSKGREGMPDLELGPK